MRWPCASPQSFGVSPVFTVGFAEVQRTRFYLSPEVSCVTRVHESSLAMCMLLGSPRAPICRSSLCSCQFSLSLGLDGFLFHKQKITWKILLTSWAHSELWEAAGRQRVPQCWSRACWIANHIPASPQQAWRHTPMLLWQISTVVVAG